MTMEIKDLERRIAPAPLRSKAGFAKTHARRCVIEGWLGDDAPASSSDKPDSDKQAENNDKRETSEPIT